MFNVLIDFELSKKIVISKLGITFRMMTKKEKVKVLEKVEELYFNNKKIINYFLRKYKSTSFEFLKEINCYDSYLQSVLQICIMFCNDEFIFNSKNEIEK